MVCPLLWAYPSPEGALGTLPWLPQSALPQSMYTGCTELPLGLGSGHITVALGILNEERGLYKPWQQAQGLGQDSRVTWNVF